MTPEGNLFGEYFFPAQRHVTIYLYNHIIIKYIYIYILQPLHLSHGTGEQGAEQQPPTIFHVGRHETAEETHHSHDLMGSWFRVNPKKRGQQSKKLQLVEKNGWLKWINPNM